MCICIRPCIYVCVCVSICICISIFTACWLQVLYRTDWWWSRWPWTDNALKHKHKTHTNMCEMTMNSFAAPMVLVEKAEDWYCIKTQTQKHENTNTKPSPKKHIRRHWPWTLVPHHGGQQGPGRLLHQNTTHKHKHKNTNTKTCEMTMVVEMAVDQ